LGKKSAGFMRTRKSFTTIEGESGGVGVMAEEHGGGGFRVAVLGKEGDKAELG
jgi:hypothetical protein